MDNQRPNISKGFLLALLAGVIFAAFMIFKPFLVEILAAGILASIFYSPYKWVKDRFGGRKRLAATLMCVLVALLVIIPLANLIVYSAQRSVEAYEGVRQFIDEGKYAEWREHPLLNQVYYYVWANENVRGVIIDIAQRANNVLASAAAALIKSTTSFFISLVLIILTMFFFFTDGRRLVERFMHLVPLPNKYNREIARKFRDVSYSTVVATFATAAAQGMIGAIGFLVVGVPAFFAGIIMAFLSLLPLVGPALVWGPVAIYLLAIGEIWQGIFLLVWGAVVVSLSDNVIRAYLIKGKAQVHPIFLIFAILGGISLFGFWGIIFGPLIISLAVTVFHIYELEYRKALES